MVGDGLKCMVPVPGRWTSGRCCTDVFNPCSFALITDFESVSHANLMQYSLACWWYQPLLLVIFFTALDSSGRPEETYLGWLKVGFKVWQLLFESAAMEQPILGCLRWLLVFPLLINRHLGMIFIFCRWLKQIQAILSDRKENHQWQHRSLVTPVHPVARWKQTKNWSKHLAWIQWWCNLDAPSDTGKGEVKSEVLRGGS